MIRFILFQVAGSYHAFNENSDREQAKLPDGSERVNIAFP